MYARARADTVVVPELLATPSHAVREGQFSHEFKPYPGPVPVQSNW